MDQNAPILIFDSGVGGLTVYDALRARLPDAPVIYAADLAGLPYGEKTEAQVSARVAGLLGRMSERFAPRLICIACNTASTIALGNVREVLEVPIVGTVPAIKPAAEATKTGVIGLIGTQATIRQRYVDDLEAQFARDKTLLRIAAPQLVDCAEAKLRGEAFDHAIVQDAVSRLRGLDRAKDIDTVVLACTHFPLLAEEIREIMGPDVRLIDGSAGIARRIAHLVDGQAMATPQSNRFVVTGPVEAAAGLGPTLSRRGFAPPERF